MYLRSDVVRNRGAVLLSLLAAATLSYGQTYQPLASLPPGLGWSRPVTHTDGHDYALLSSEALGTYLVRGDSAVRISGVAYAAVSSTPDGLRVSPPLADQAYRTVDSLVDAGTGRVEPLPPTARSYPWVGGFLDGDGRLLSVRSRVRSTRTAEPYALRVPSVGDGASFAERTAPTSALASRRDLSVADGAVFTFAGWDAADGRVASVERAAVFDAEHAVGGPGRAVWLSAVRAGGQSGAEAFTELDAEPVGIAVVDGGYVVATESSAIALDSLLREQTLARLPSEFRPRSVLGLGREAWLLVDAPSGKTQLARLDGSLDVAEQWELSAPAERVAAVAPSRLGTRVLLAGERGGAYALWDAPVGDLAAGGFTRLPDAGSVLAKAAYPLPDTLPAVRPYRRNTRRYLSDEPTLREARVLQDSGLLLEFGDWRELRGASGQWRSNWDPGLAEADALTLPTGAFRAAGDSFGGGSAYVVRDAGGGVDTLVDASPLTYHRVLGSPAPGLSLVETTVYPLRDGFQEKRLVLIDSLGRWITNVYGPLPARGLFSRAYFPGLLTVSSSVTYGTDRRPIANEAVVYAAWPLLGLPVEAPAVACRVGDTVAFSWPGSQNLFASFRYGGEGTYDGTYFGQRYRIPAQAAFLFEDAVERVDVEPVCGELLAGRVGVVPAAGFPLGRVTIDGEVGATRSYDQATIVGIVVTDVAGCEALATRVVTRATFRPGVQDACADGDAGGTVTLYAGSDTAYLAFANGTYVDRRRGLTPGTYPVTFASSAGCTYDSLVTIVAAPPAIPTLDSAYIGFDQYRVGAEDPDRDYEYTYRWSDGSSGPEAFLAAGATHEVYVRQRSPRLPSGCLDTLAFRLGTGTSETRRPLHSELRAWIGADDRLHVVGLPPGAATEVELFDGVGRRVLSVPVTGDAVAIERRGRGPRGWKVVRVAGRRARAVWW